MYSYYVQQLCEHIHVPIDSSSHFSQKILLNTPLYMYYSFFSSQYQLLDLFSKFTKYNLNLIGQTAFLRWLSKIVTSIYSNQSTEVLKARPPFVQSSED